MIAISASKLLSWVHTGNPAKLRPGGVMKFQLSGIYLSSLKIKAIRLWLDLWMWLKPAGIRQSVLDDHHDGIEIEYGRSNKYSYTYTDQVASSKKFTIKIFNMVH